MPSVSKAQQHFFGAELARKRAGKATTTGMSEGQLRDFAATKTKGLPQHVGGHGRSRGRERGRRLAAAKLSRKQSAPTTRRAAAAAKSGNTPKRPRSMTAPAGAPTPFGVKRAMAGVAGGF